MAFFDRKGANIKALIFLCAGLLSACAPFQILPATQPAPPAQLQIQAEPTQTPLPATADPTPTPQSPPIFKGPLSVIITSPLDHEIVNASPVEIKGQADPDTVITLNDQVLLVDDRGTFTLQLPLEPGLNVIEITASDSQDQQDFAYLTLSYEP